MKRILATVGEGAALLNISERRFHVLRKRPDFAELCPEVRLSARAVRFRVADLENFAAHLAARPAEPLPEPPQLAQGRRRARELAGSAPGGAQ